MVRRGAAAAANNIDQPVASKALDLRGHGFRRFIILAEFVRKAGIGIGADKGVGNARQFIQMRTHGIGAEGAIQSDGERSCMAQ